MTGKSIDPRAVCWVCHGWPRGLPMDEEPITTLYCGYCSGTGMDMIPWTELFRGVKW